MYTTKQKKYIKKSPKIKLKKKNSVMRVLSKPTHHVMLTHQALPLMSLFSHPKKKKMFLLLGYLVLNKIQTQIHLVTEKKWKNMRENIMTRQTCNMENYVEHRNNMKKMNTKYMSSAYELTNKQI